MEKNTSWLNVFNQHVFEIKKNKNFLYVSDCIIGDMLMGKITFTNNKIEIFLTESISNLIKEWKLMSLYLSKFNQEIIVFRGVRKMQPLDRIEQPIPFSTCIEYENAELWTNNDGFIMKIFVSNNINYTFLDNKDEGYEVILPPGFLIKKNQQNNYIEYDFFQNI